MNLKSLFSSTALFTVFMAITVFHVAKASEQVVATVTSDETPLTYNLVIDSKDGRSIQSFYKDSYQSGKKISRENMDPKVITKSGMVLEQRDEYVVIKLKSDNFDFEQGGMIVVDTLYNGASGERRGYEVQLAHDKNGWAIFKQGKTIKQISIQTNRLIVLGTVGIKNLVMK